MSRVERRWRYLVKHLRRVERAAESCRDAAATEDLVALQVAEADLFHAAAALATRGFALQRADRAQLFSDRRAAEAKRQARQTNVNARRV
jgi:hypothetical protein